MIKDDEAQVDVPTIAGVLTPSGAPVTMTAPIDFRLGDTVATAVLPSRGPNHGRCLREDDSGVTGATHSRPLDRHRCNVSCRPGSKP
jgi:hypothetical protein